MEKLDKNIIEWAIQVALFKAATEQNSMLIGTTKQQSKVIFKRWSKEGQNLLKIIEAQPNTDLLEELTEEIENAVHKIRKKY
tara:strand:+ start:645 stop:890 length:246 start_codon:yes stop_codon:yes gene_type:complete